MKHLALLSSILCAGLAAGQTLNCDLVQYKPQPGLRADVDKDLLRIAWQGEGGQELRAVLGIEKGQPLIRELAARKAGGAWIVLGRDLLPEFRVTSGRRRVSEQQLAPLRKLKIELTPEVLEQEKWNAFWDAPLSVPGRAGHQSRPSAQPRRNPPRQRHLQRRGLPGEVRRRANGSLLPRSGDGHLLGQADVHGLQGNQPAPAGSHRQNRRAIGGLQVRGRPEGIHHRRRESHLARHRARVAGVPFRRPAQQRSVRPAGPKSPGRRRTRRRIAGVFPAAPQVFLRPRNRAQPGLRLLSQGRRAVVRGGRAPARPRRDVPPLRLLQGTLGPPCGPVPPVCRGQLRALQRAAGHLAAHAGLFLPERRRRPRHPGGGAGASLTTTLTSRWPAIRSPSAISTPISTSSWPTPARSTCSPPGCRCFARSASTSP